MIRAVFGGSFDPVHRAHRALVQDVFARGLADHIHVVPAWLSPHKSTAIAAPGDRLAMVRLVFDPVADVTIETLEIDGGRPAYTADTLAALRSRYPDDGFRLVLGADQLDAFRRWHEPERILNDAELILVARQSPPLADLCAGAGVPRERCHLLSDFDEPVSATRIRATLERGEDAGPWLSPPVAEYIRRHGLYRDGDPPSRP